MTWLAWRDFPWLDYLGLVLSSALLVYSIYLYMWPLCLPVLLFWIHFNRKLWFLTRAD